MPSDPRATPSARVALLVAAATARLTAGGVPTEVLGRVVAPRRVLGIPRAMRIVPDGVAWRLGSLLLTPAGLLAVTDVVVIARSEVRRGYTAQGTRERAELAAAAARGGIAEGATAHVGWHAVDLDALDRCSVSDPLASHHGVVYVRWGPGPEHLPLAEVLSERVALALDTHR